VSAEDSAFEQALLSRIAREGPLPLADYMGLCNAHYYGGRDPLGAAGDFVTAPEISQMFGELIGLWLADLWARSGAPADAAYVELGPGRGTLAADALRAMGRAGLRPAVHLVETSPVLRAAQRARLPDTVHHDDVASLPADCPLLIVANEFFDALPARQLQRTGAGWRERCVGHDGERLALVHDDADVSALVPPALRDAPVGAVVETSPATAAIAAELSGRLARQGGAALIVDYGHEGPAIGDTVQAVARHRFADPLAAPGQRDVTAHVDFTPVAEAARNAGLRVTGPVGQGAFLAAIGIDARARQLAVANPAAAIDIETARKRLVDPAAMGDLFRVLAVGHPGWARPEGFGEHAA
jgi:SAM-dependent MidA family methyltransferase